MTEPAASGAAECGATTKQQESSAPPEGFELLLGTEIGFNKASGPHFVRMLDGVPILGFRVEAKHLNPSGMCHGAALAAFADLLAVPVRHLAGLHETTTPTVSLSIDFMAPVLPNAWVELHGRLLRRTKTLLFGDGTIQANGTVAARVNGIFIIGSPRPVVGYDIAPGQVTAI